MFFVFHSSKNDPKQHVNNYNFLSGPRHSLHQKFLWKRVASGCRQGALPGCSAIYVVLCKHVQPQSCTFNLFWASKMCFAFRRKNRKPVEALPCA